MIQTSGYYDVSSVVVTKIAHLQTLTTECPVLVQWVGAAVAEVVEQVIC